MWTISKSLRNQLDKSMKSISEMPYTLAFVIRKRIQIDTLNELPEDKRPPDNLVWDGTSEEINDWIKTALGNKLNQENYIYIDENDIER